MKSQFAPPSNFTAEVMRNTVNFKWKSVEGVSGYHLYRNGELILTTQDFSYLDENLIMIKIFSMILLLLIRW